MPDNRLIQTHRPGRTIKTGITETENATVSTHQPITPPITSRGHPDNRLIQTHRPGRTIKTGITETENATVSTHQPITPPITSRGHPDNRLIQTHRPGRTIKTGITETENATVSTHHVVALAVVGSGQARLPCAPRLQDPRGTGRRRSRRPPRGRPRPGRRWQHGPSLFPWLRGPPRCGWCSRSSPGGGRNWRSQPGRQSAAPPRRAGPGGQPRRPPGGESGGVVDPACFGAICPIWARARLK